MKTPYYDYNGIHVACIFKSGSSAIARAIHFALKPDYQIISASGNADMVERVMHNPGWQSLAPKTFEPINPIIPVRDPVERFRSACAQEGKTAEEALNLLDEGEASTHFRKQSDFLIGDCTLYKFPEHIVALATAIGLDGIPEVNTSETNNGPKPDLTPEQLARVEALYADDIALYESITTAGQIYTVPATDEAKTLKREELATARHIAVDGGTTFNGIPIRTDDQTRNELSTARQFAKDDPNMVIEWKLSNGSFISLDAPTIIAIANAVLAHQQAQFTHEKELNALVDSATTAEELNDINW
jgi:hypothetical protein